MNKTPEVCIQCILPATFPGIRFDENGVCSQCSAAPSREEMDRFRAKLKESLANVIKDKKGQGRDFDCVVAFSGGKDSTYILKLLVEKYSLRCLAITVDNGFIAETARLNGQRVTKALGVDFLLYTPSPSFIMNMYRTSAENSSVHSKAAIKRASNICNSCINLINNYMVRTALEKDIPLIAGGYVGGQIPKDTAVMEIDVASHTPMREAALKSYQKTFGKESSRYFNIAPSLLSSAKSTNVTILNPMLTIAITESELLEAITPLGWERPEDTGDMSSNCRLNDLGIAVHFKQHGFHPYVMELAEQVRNGLLSREAGLKKASSIPEWADVQEQAEAIRLPHDAIQ